MVDNFTVSSATDEWQNDSWLPQKLETHSKSFQLDQVKVEIRFLIYRSDDKISNLMLLQLLSLLMFWSLIK